MVAVHAAGETVVWNTNNLVSFFYGRLYYSQKQFIISSVVIEGRRLKVITELEVEACCIVVLIRIAVVVIKILLLHGILYFFPETLYFLFS